MLEALPNAVQNVAAPTGTWNEERRRKQKRGETVK